jgi:aryl-alcohol dehydrogenase-like predicted oxidoreductase
VVGKIPKSHSASMSQISLVWVIAKDRVIAILGAKPLEQIRENAQASDIDLTQTEICELNEASKVYRQALHIPRPFEIFKWLFTCH